MNDNTSGPGAKEVVAELEQCGRRAEAIQADVARADQVRAMVDRGLGRFGRLDILVNILVNSEGVMTRGAFLDVPVADYATMFAINVPGTFLCTQHARRPMVAARYGRNITFSTQFVRASVGTGGFAAYAATKRGRGLHPHDGP